MKWLRRLAVVAALLVAALAVAYGFRSRILVAMGLPPHADREAAPAGLAARALPVGAVAPAFRLPSTAGGDWGPTAQRTVLVFYRGDW